MVSGVKQDVQDVIEREFLCAGGILFIPAISRAEAKGDPDRGAKVVLGSGDLRYTQDRQEDRRSAMARQQVIAFRRKREVPADRNRYSSSQQCGQRVVVEILGDRNSTNRCGNLVFLAIDANQSMGEWPHVAPVQ